MRDRLIELIKQANKKCASTTKCEDCSAVDTGDQPDDCLKYKIADEILEDGWIRLPCKVGDTVYTNLSMQGWYYRIKDRPYTARIVFIGVNDSEETGCGYINVLFEKNHNMMQFRFSDIGKTVFLTREEAEQALKGEHDG